MAAFLLLLTRVPAASEYLSIDNVNLAFALDKFDPRVHQPHPPGYPFFVGFAKLIDLAFGDAERTFLVISVLVSGLCLPVLAALGGRMFHAWTGYAAALLLLFNPVFWQSGLDGPLRPNLALFSILTAYCAWRAWNGERRYVFWGAVALGVGSGFRPDLLAYLGPVWLISAWVGTRSVKTVVEGLGVLCGIVLVWVASLVYAVGGVRALYDLTATYLIEQSRIESVLMGAEEHAWLKQFSRLVIWNGLAIVGWIWAAPFFAVSRQRAGLLGAQSLFMLAWLVPGLTFQALVHVAAPGHTLFSIPAWCLLGGYVLWTAVQRWSDERQSAERIAELSVTAAVALNVMVFLNYFPLPSPSVLPGWQSAKNQVALQTFEASISQIRWLDEVSRATMAEFAQIAPADRPVVIVSNDIHYQQWFMNWRIARYYAPETDIWVMAEQRTPKLAFLTRRDQTIESRTGDIIPIPIPRGGRVVWLLEIGNPFHQQLEKLGNAVSTGRLLYTDVAADAKPFRILDFEFVPTDVGMAEDSPDAIQ